MPFQDVFREERYYCNHFFRLLCERLSNTPESSGLARVLKRVGIPLPPSEALRQAEVYTEVAAFRDVFFHVSEKDAFLEGLFDSLLPLLQPQYKGLIGEPLRPSKLRARIGTAHPSKYADLVDEPDFEKSDVLFYREFGALFNAKPDFLVLLPAHAVWIEAKCSSAFSSSQVQRMRNIGALCASPLLGEYFGGREPSIVLLGSARRHAKAQGVEHTRFLSWEQCAGIAADVFAAGAEDVTARALARVAA